MWGILSTTTNTTDVEEVTIDSSANWKPKKSEEDNDCKRLTKAMSPGSMNLPTMNNWDTNQAMSPYMPPDMNSIVSGSMMNTSSPSQPQYGNNGQNHRNSSTTSSSAPGSTSSNVNSSSSIPVSCSTAGTPDMGLGANPGGNNDYNGPGSHMNDSVNPLDQLNAIDKSFSDQVRAIPLYYMIKYFGVSKLRCV